VIGFVSKTNLARPMALDHEIENHCTSVMLVEVIKGVKQAIRPEFPQ
jgi:hypothetical protein